MHYNRRTNANWRVRQLRNLVSDPAIPLPFVSGSSPASRSRRTQQTGNLSVATALTNPSLFLVSMNLPLHLWENVYQHLLACTPWRLWRREKMLIFCMFYRAVSAFRNLLAVIVHTACSSHLSSHSELGCTVSVLPTYLPSQCRHQLLKWWSWKFSSSFRSSDHK